MGSQFPSWGSADRTSSTSPSGPRSSSSSSTLADEAMPAIDCSPTYARRAAVPPQAIRLAAPQWRSGVDAVGAVHAPLVDRCRRRRASRRATGVGLRPQGLVHARAERARAGAGSPPPCRPRSGARRRTTRRRTPVRRPSRRWDQARPETRSSTVASPARAASPTEWGIQDGLTNAPVTSGPPCTRLNIRRAPT